METTGRVPVAALYRRCDPAQFEFETTAEVEKGRFHVYAIETIDQGIEILTGVPAGELDGKGDYPEGTVNHLARKRLSELAERRQAFGRAGEGGEA